MNLFSILSILYFRTVTCIHLEEKLIMDLMVATPKCKSLIYITDWSIHEKVKFKQKLNVNITIDYHWSTSLVQTDAQKLLIVVDLRNEYGRHFLTQISYKAQYFRHPYRWLFLINKNITEVDGIKDIYMLADSNLIFGSEQNDETFILQQIYKLNETEDEFIYENYGKWHYSNGLSDERDSIILSRRRRNLHQRQFRIPIVLTKSIPIGEFNNLRNKEVDSITKVSGILVQSLAATLNATLNFIEYSTWGYLDPKTGKHDGMFGDIIDGTGEIGGSPAFMIPYRIATVDYLSMMVPSRAYFIFRAPPLSYVSNIYYLPFQTNVWIVSIILMVLSMIVLYITYRLIQNKYPTYCEDIATGSEVTLIGVGAICQMGYTKEPKIISGRISMYTLLLSALFIFTSYSANIVALLQSTTKSIRNVEDLLKFKIELGVEDISYSRFYFPRQTDPIKKQIYEKKIANKNDKFERFYNISYGIRRMQTDFFAFHIEGGRGYTEIEKSFYEHEKCDLIEISYLDVVDPWFFVKKHSPFKEIIKVNAFKLREHGIANRENLRYYTPKPRCTAKSQYFSSVRLEDCYAPFMALIYGFSLGFGSFLLEILITRSKFMIKA